MPTNKRTNGFGVKTGPKVLRIGQTREQGKPYRLSCEGVESRKADNGLEGIGSPRKRMLICNGCDRSSKFAPVRKGADF